MKEKLQSIKDEALRAIEAADVPEKLNDVRVKFLGKKGELTAVLKSMKDVAPEERPKVGHRRDASGEEEYGGAPPSKYDRAGRSRENLRWHGL